MHGFSDRRIWQGLNVYFALPAAYSVDQCSLGNLTVSKDFRCYSVNARAACCYLDGTCAANDIENDTNTCTEGLPACCRADGG